MADARPFRDADRVLETAARLWQALPPTEWQAAFDSHPRIGEQQPHHATAQSIAWSAAEQASLRAHPDATNALARANAAYEARFGRIFLICASGRSADEILAEAHRRMHSDDATELAEAVEQQRQITVLRLRRWLGEDPE